MSFSKQLLSLVMVISLAACGGGGGSAGTSSNSTPVSAAATPASIEVLTSADSVLSAGSETLITAYVKNQNNVAMAAQKLEFSTSSGTLLAPAAVTDANGTASVKLIAGVDKSTRNITVTVTAGTAIGRVVLPVTGTKLAIAGSGSLQVGGGAEQYTVRAVDSSGTGISGASISVSSSLGNSASPVSLTTDLTGGASFIYTPNKAGTDTVTVAGLGVSAQTQVVVNSIDFVALSPASNTTIPVGSLGQVVRVKYRLNGVGVSSQTVSFTTTRGAFTTSSATTDANGEAFATVSSTTAGPAVVVAQIAGVGQVNLPLQFVATTPASIVVQSNPGAILPNLSGSTHQSTIEAVVRDAGGNAVSNRQVNFTILQDVSNGSLMPGVATTDADGRANVQFIAGATSTPANGVILQATVASTAISGQAKLTVNGTALFITIGFGNTMTNLDETTYSKPFSVYVTDANGVAVGNQLVALSVIPEVYRKGFMTWVDPSWRSTVMATCQNEDANLDGRLDTGEDTNGNGQLTPGNVVVASPGSVTTDAAGRASFNLQYGEQFADWVRVQIVARASVGGTESKQSISFDVPALASDLTAETVTPAGVKSPFGESSSCSNGL